MKEKHFCMDIFNMSDSDIEQVKQIEKDCRNSPWSLLDYKNEIGRKDGLTFVIKKQSRVIGFALARLITKPKVCCLEYRTEIEIYNIAVKPDFQNQGVGQKLINQIVDCTASLESRDIWLEVRESNTKAINFYEKNEFIKVYKRKNLYTNPNEDGIVMKKSLKKF